MSLNEKEFVKLLRDMQEEVLLPFIREEIRHAVRPAVIHELQGAAQDAIYDFLSKEISRRVRVDVSIQG